MALPQQAGQPIQRRLRLQQGAQGVVQQRVRLQAAPARRQPAQQHQREPARAGGQGMPGRGAIHLLGVEVAPERLAARRATAT
jgi:hypothetical protein